MDWVDGHGQNGAGQEEEHGQQKIWGEERQSEHHLHNGGPGREPEGEMEVSRLELAARLCSASGNPLEAGEGR